MAVIFGTIKKERKKKHLQIFFSRAKKALGLNLGILHRGPNIYQICSNDGCRLIFGRFEQQNQICAPIYSYGENAEKPHFQNVLKTNG